MRDARIDAYARLLVERSVGVQNGWQVYVRATPLARPLLEAVEEEIARRGAYPIVYMGWDSVGGQFARYAPLEVLARPAPLLLRAWEECDAFIAIAAPENVRDGSDLSDERRRLLQERMEPLRRRQMGMHVPWVICQFPTNAAAQEAGMTLPDYEDFVLGSVLLDWDAEARRMLEIARLFDAADEVRIVADGTDLRLSLAGRTGAVEDATEGVVTFSEFPGLYYGHEVSGVRLVFEGGRVVDASAAFGEDFLLKTLDTDEGARRLGELGIGCNRGICRYTKNVGFDEKIDGTIHLAIGNSYSGDPVT